MQQESTVDKAFFVSSVNSSRKCEFKTKLLPDRHEPPNFTLQYAEILKALGFGVGFKAIYTAYVKQREAV